MTVTSLLAPISYVLFTVLWYFEPRWFLVVLRNKSNLKLIGQQEYNGCWKLRFREWNPYDTQNVELWFGKTSKKGSAIGELLISYCIFCSRNEKENKKGGNNERVSTNRRKDSWVYYFKIRLHLYRLMRKQ